MPGKRVISSNRHLLLALAAAIVLALTVFSAPHGALALTDLKKSPEAQSTKDEADQAEPSAEPDAEEEENLDDAKPGIPMPESLIKKPGDKAGAVDDKSDDKADEPTKPSEIILDLSTLPEPVKKLRVAIVEAAASGDIERLRPLMSSGEDQTQVSIGDAPDDPIAALKSLSGDGDGREILAILLDIISTGAARVDPGTPDETYVWPYFAEKKLDTLTPPEIVELYRIVTASDVNDMKEFGGYNFYRIGITPDGKWKFFVAGD
jgi:hypothetical protein